MALMSDEVDATYSRLHRLAFLLLAAYLRRDAARARMIIAQVSDDDLDEFHQGLRYLADVTAEPLEHCDKANERPALEIFAAMTDADHEAVILTICDRADRNAPFTFTTRLEWGAIIHFSAALCAAHLDATGKNLDQIVAGFLREARR